MSRPITHAQAKRLTELRRDCRDLMHAWDMNDHEARSILGVADNWLDTAGYVADYLNGVGTRKKLLAECDAYINSRRSTTGGSTT